MSIRAWIENNLWSENYFQPSLAGDESEIFRSGASFPLVTSLIDGCSGSPTWTRQPAESPTGSLFESLRPIVAKYGASWFYVTDPDNALSVFHWEREIDAQYFNQYVLDEFEKNRAVEGGASYMCIGLHDQSGVIVFELDESFKISFYGKDERENEIKSALNRDADVLRNQKG